MEIATKNNDSDNYAPRVEVQCYDNVHEKSRNEEQYVTHNTDEHLYRREHEEDIDANLSCDSFIDSEHEISNESDDSSSNSTDKDVDDDRPLLNVNMASLAIPVTFKNHISVKEELLKVIAVSMRHRLTYEATLAIMKCIDSQLVHRELPTTKKAFWAAFSRNESIVTRHMYCRKCKGYVGKENEPLQQCPCKACGPEQEKNWLSYFIQSSLVSQLQKLLAIPGIADSLRYRFTRSKEYPDAIEDIYDGEEYKKKTLPGAFLDNEYNFSLILNTDGCKVANSSNASAWPILLEIIELPPHARKRYMLLAGVWVDDQHPILNTLLQPIITELQVLSEEGVTWKPDGITPLISKFTTLICSVDSIARPALLRMTQFNGKYGCTFCYATGRSLPGKGGCRTYPVEENAPDRTDDEIRTHMHQAFEAESKVFGVKGPSVLMLLPEFDLSAGVVNESMHSVYLGVTKQVTEMILLGKADSPWYVGSPKECALIDERLMKIRPPNRISRKPRPVATIKQWKTSEWRNWLLYYCLPCLEGVAKKQYHDHLALLSRAIFTLNKESINSEELNEARLLLKNFVHDFQKLFGIENMTFNIHLLTHLTNTVQNWGPLWSHNAFPFESWNKRIIDAVTSAKSRPLQIVTRFLMARFIDGAIYDPEVGQETREFINSILHGNKQMLERDNNASLPPVRFHGLGKETIRRPHDWESRLLRKAGYDCQNLRLFNRANINGNEYRCRGENEKTRFCNEFVYCNSSGFGEIIEIVHFYCDTAHICGLFVQRLRDIGRAFHAQHIRNVVETEKVLFIRVDDIKGPSLKIQTPNGLRCIRLSNSWETD